MLDVLSGFVAELRAAGLPVSLTEHLDAAEAVHHIPLEDREALKYALAATLVKSSSHWRAFETAFEIYFANRTGGADGDERIGRGDGSAEGEARGRPRPPAPAGEGGRGTGRGGGGGEALSPEELAELLYRALLTGDDALMAVVARHAVDRYAGMEPGRPVGGTYYLYRTLRNLDLDGVLERLMGQAPDTAGDGRAHPAGGAAGGRRVPGPHREAAPGDRDRDPPPAGGRPRGRGPGPLDAQAPARGHRLHARHPRGAGRPAPGPPPALPQAGRAPGPQAPPRPPGPARLPGHHAPLAVHRRRARWSRSSATRARPSPRSSSSPTSRDRWPPSPASPCTWSTPSARSSPRCAASSSSTASTR